MESNAIYNVIQLCFDKYGRIFPLGTIIIEETSHKFLIDIIDTPDADPWKEKLKNCRSAEDYLQIIAQINLPFCVKSKSVIWTDSANNLFWREVETTLVDWAENTPWE